METWGVSSSVHYAGWQQRRPVTHNARLTARHPPGAQAHHPSPHTSPHLTVTFHFAGTWQQIIILAPVLNLNITSALSQYHVHFISPGTSVSLLISLHYYSYCASTSSLQHHFFYLSITSALCLYHHFFISKTLHTPHHHYITLLFITSYFTALCLSPFHYFTLHLPFSHILTSCHIITSPMPLKSSQHSFTPTSSQPLRSTLHYTWAHLTMSSPFNQPLLSFFLT